MHSIIIDKRNNFKSQSEKKKCRKFFKTQKYLKGSFIFCVRKISGKTNISHHLIRTQKLTFFTPLIRTRTCAYQEVRNVSFPENFPHVLNESSLIASTLFLFKLKSFCKVILGIESVIKFGKCKNVQWQEKYHCKSISDFKN